MKPNTVSKCTSLISTRCSHCNFSLYFLSPPLPSPFFASTNSLANHTTTQPQFCLSIRPFLRPSRPNHDRQHLTLHRIQSRRQTSTLPLLPNHPIRHLLRLLPLGLPLPLHVLSTPSLFLLTCSPSPLLLPHPCRLSYPRVYRCRRQG